MKIHYLQHVPFEGLGSIESWAKLRGHDVTCTKFHAHGSLPGANRFDWLIIMGGPMNVYQEERYPWLVDEKRFIEQAINEQKVVIGICLGAQLLAAVMGARIYANEHKEIGWFPVTKTSGAAQSRIFHDFPDEIEVFHWHGDTFDLPSGAIRTASSAGCENQAFVYNDRVTGLQFHLESTAASVQQLVEHCGDELVGGRYIQSREQMLDSEARLRAINSTLNVLLDRF